jgi:DNA-binding CsgD family transcriptional regulator
MAAQGHPNKVIAAVLNISSWTVCTHLRRIFAKLGVGSRAAMVARLLEVGSVDNHIRKCTANAKMASVPSALSQQEGFPEKSKYRAARS